MRKQGRSALVVVGAVALGAAVVAAIWLRADASASRAEALRSLCERDRAYHRRAAAMAELVEIDSTTSREALEELAASKEDRLAAQALAAMGRANYSGAKDSLTAVVGDGKRSDVVRGTALAALFHAEKADGGTRSEAESAVASKTGENEMLEGPTRCRLTSTINADHDTRDDAVEVNATFTTGENLPCQDNVVR